ncbi:MAG: MarR family transcriptional regulator [Deltaproteobacteria bacterium]|nr:MarR family transcriptional regulator [Deltaproteobacteria bacterium]MBW2359834.1 MarR family transcriptional regulator [Deltaproteobacteria bacterium]
MANAATPAKPVSDEIHRAIEALQRLSELFGQRRAQLAREAGVTEAQWRMLEQVDDADFLPSLFARQRACTPAAVSRTLRQLLDADLVRVSIGAEDGRQRIYQLSARGRRVLGGLRQGRAAAIASVWQPLGKRALAQFARFAEGLADRLEAYADSV